MGTVIFDPLIHNVTVLSDQHALCDVEREYIADPFAQVLVPRATFLGWTITWLYYIFEYFGWCSAQKNLQTVLKTAQVALSLLKSHLLECQDQIPSPISTFLSLSFDEQWQRRFRHVDRLLSGKLPFPSFEKAQRVVAPIIVQEITRSPIPWDLFDALLHKKPLSLPEEHRLKEWIEDVRIWGTSISPFLLLSLCEAAANRFLPNDSASHVASGAFFLAWMVYKAGLPELSFPDLDAPDVKTGMISTPEGDEEVHFGGPVPLPFPIDFPISAYSVEGHPNLMALSSPCPLLLGMWMHNINECPSAIPTVQPVSCDSRGRYVIVERLITSLAGEIWEDKGCNTAHDGALLEKISNLWAMLIRFPRTLDIRLDHLFLTSELEIRTLAPVKERFPFFCLAWVEKTIRAMCRQDQERIRILFQHIDLWSHPQAQMYTSLIENYACSASDPAIRREIAVFDVDQENFLYVADWARTLRDHASTIREQLKSVPEYSSLSRRRRVARLVSAVVRSQGEIGWISDIPVTLPEYVVGVIKEGLSKSDASGVSLNGLVPAI